MPTHTRRFRTQWQAIAFMRGLDNRQDGRVTKDNKDKKKPYVCKYTPMRWVGHKGTAPPSANVRRFKRPFGQWIVTKNSTPRDHVSYVGAGYSGDDDIAWCFYVERLQNGKKAHPRNYFIYARKFRYMGREKARWRVEVWMTTSVRTGARHLIDYPHIAKSAAKRRMATLQKSLYNHLKTNNRVQWNPPRS